VLFEPLAAAKNARRSHGLRCYSRSKHEIRSTKSETNSKAERGQSEIGGEGRGGWSMEVNGSQWKSMEVKNPGVGGLEREAWVMV
jgi:hypothetical protein